MPDPRVVLGRIAPLAGLAPTVLVVAIALLPSARAAETLKFLEPVDGAMVSGPAVFRLAVPEQAQAIDRVDVYIGPRLIGAAFSPGWEIAWDEERTLRGETVSAIAYAGETIVGRTEVRTRNFGGMQHVQVELVQLYPVVRDSGGRFVRGLTRDDFVVYENGVEVPLKHCASEVHSLNIALLLDISRSMHTKLSRVQDASIRFADQLGAADWLALYAFNHRVHEVVPLTVEHQQVREKIWQLQASGGTALYDGLLEVVERTREVPGRKAVVLFSDGHDKLSLASLSRVAREATRSEVIVYAVGAGLGVETARDDLALLASRSGGQAWFIQRPRELADVYRQIRLHLKAQYLLSYAPPDGPEELRQIEVKVRNRGYDVQCRTSYHYVPGQ